MFWGNAVSIGSCSYWVRMVTGEFGAWKTKNVFRESITQRKVNNPDWVIFANIPYDHVDYVFNTVDDFVRLLWFVSSYMRDTNHPDYLKENYKNFRPILFIVDESHVYLFARNFAKNISNDLIITLTQCRKRNIQILFITQDLAQIDVMVRRLCPEVTNYKPFLWLTLWINIYYKIATATDLWDEYSAEITGRYIIRPDRVRKLFDKKYKNFLLQKYLTKYVIWYTEEFTYSYNDFLSIFKDNGKVFDNVILETNNLDDDSQLMTSIKKTL